jgi:hypothetical protein
MYALRMGIPEMEALWNDLTSRADQGSLSRSEKIRFKKLVKVLAYLTADPRHPSLCSHDIEPLSKRYGFKVWQSYLENRKPAAGRLFWAYGPGRKEISILGLEPHPEDSKRGAYARIKLSQLPDEPLAS